MTSTTKLDVRADWWDNFTYWAFRQYGNNWKIDAVLAQHGARNLPDYYIEFDTEAAVAAFILKWS